MKSENEVEEKIEEGFKNFVEKPRRGILKVFLWILSIVVLITLMTYVIRTVMAPVKGTMEVIERTYDGDKMFSDYEWFYNQNASYLAIKAQIEIAEEDLSQFKVDAGDRKDWTFEDKNEASRIRTVVTGLKFQLKNVIKAYNARSDMWTRNQFKGGDLPYKLPLN